MTTLTNPEICELVRHTCLFGTDEHERDHLLDYITDSSSVIERAGLFERMHILEHIFDKANLESIEDMFVKAVKAQLHSTVDFCLKRGVDSAVVQRSLRQAALSGHVEMIDRLLPHIPDDDDIDYVLRVVQQTAVHAHSKAERASFNNHFEMLQQRWDRHKIARELPSHNSSDLKKRKI